MRAFQFATPPLPVDGIAGPVDPRRDGHLERQDHRPGWTGHPRRRATVRGRRVASRSPTGTSPPTASRTTATTSPARKANANIIAAEFDKDGADDATQQWAVYIASREGGCNYATVNLNLATRDDSHCTFQLNALAGMFEPHGELGRRGWTVDNVKESMQNCADAASDLWVYCGRGPWTPPYALRTTVGRRHRLRRRLIRRPGSSAPVGGAVEVVGHGAVVVEHDEAVEAAQEPAVVGDGDDGALELGEAGLQRLRRDEVEVVGRLVEQQQRRPATAPAAGSGTAPADRRSACRTVCSAQPCIS